MNNFAKFAATPKKDEAKITQSFLSKASNISASSTQKEICNLIADIADYKLYSSSSYKNTLTYLQNLLSNCIASKCNGDTKGFEKLKSFVKSKSGQIR
ncbi:MAG: hypothetical protein IJ690_00335 [Clostridia bacterium]|nr:hypothetical protein [Clostridia bacterium]